MATYRIERHDGAERPMDGSDGWKAVASGMELEDAKKAVEAEIARYWDEKNPLPPGEDREIACILEQAVFTEDPLAASHVGEYDDGWWIRLADESVSRKEA